MTIKLRTLAESELTAFQQSQLETLVNSFSKIKRSQEQDVHSFCQQQLEKDIDIAIASPQDFFLAIVNSNTQEVVGSLWYQLHQESVYSDLVYIYWLGIYEDFRRKGYAKRALRELQTNLKQQGINRIALQVYNNNLAAMNFYKACGFAPKRTILHKYFDE